MNDEPASWAVELRGVSKRFGPRVILETIDLCIARGEVVMLVGQSGSGKSTLLKIVSGIETPDSGRVFLGGRDCTEQPPYRRPVHTVFQSYALFPHLDVAGNVAFPLSVAGRPRREIRPLVAEALGWVKLAEHARRRVETLSGGERQRVALARALVDSPQCVLLDEPLSALDPNLRADTLDLLAGIQRRLGTTFLFITHDRDEALRLGHRIGILNGGRLEQIGTPEEVYRRPQTAFVASFLGKINWLRGERQTRGDAASVMIAGVPIPCPGGRNLHAGAVRVGVRPEDVEIGSGGLLPARVIERRFLGDSIVIRLLLADGTEIVADRRAPFTGTQPGEEVRVGWSPEASFCFPLESDEAKP